MALTIKILQGDDAQAGKELTLDKTTVLIGRGSDQDVRINNDSVSRRHCVIEKREGQWRIIEEDTRNGIYVNGQRVQKTRVIKHEDVIEIGEAMFRVGLDRKMREESAGGKASTPVIVRTISAVTILIMLGLAGSGLYLLKLYKDSMDRIVAPLPVALGEPEVRTVFEETPDQTKLTFKSVKVQPGWVQVDRTNFVNPVPEWDYDLKGGIWTTEQAGKQPRLFDGLDLDLPGGEQAVSSGYFFCRRQYKVRDASDPVGVLYVELEGWSGFGARYGNEKSIPAIRMPELPHYVHSIELFPDRIKEASHSGWDGVQTATFNFTMNLEPPVATGNPDYDQALVPQQRETIISKLVPERKDKDVVMIGRYTSFFKDGNRYTVTVRGSANLLNRFVGGLDAVSSAIVDSISIEPPAKRPAFLQGDALAQKIKEKSTMLVSAARKPLTADAITYPDLLEVRNMLLAMQQSPDPLPGEEELRRQYFMVRNKVQKDLVISAHNIYDGRMNKKSAEGERELLRIRQFMSGEPSLTALRGDPGYPEWAWYYEDVIADDSLATNPYAKLKIKATTKRRNN